MKQSYLFMSILGVLFSEVVADTADIPDVAGEIRALHRLLSEARTQLETFVFAVKWLQKR